MADKITLLLTSSMRSIKALETTCNANEVNLDANLISLNTVTVNGAKATEAMFDSEKKNNLGNMKIKKFKTADEEKAEFKGKAFILTVSTDVQVFR